MEKKKYRIPEEEQLKRVQEALARNPDLRKTHIIMRMGVPRELVNSWMEQGLVSIRLLSSKDCHQLFNRGSKE